MDKSPEAFRTISEVADFLDTPAHVLRFWESRFPQIRPVKRAGGRRYYRPADVALLAGIKKLLHDEGMTIRGVQKILREHGIRHVASLASGETGRVFDDADVEAVLSAEYGLRDRLTDGDPPSPEALQSAQIISLETALNRQDAARETDPAQPELWPSADLDSPPDDAEAAIWPADPGDPAMVMDDPHPSEIIPADAAKQEDAPTAWPSEPLLGQDDLPTDLNPIKAEASEPASPPDVTEHSLIHEQPDEAGLPHAAESSPSMEEDQSEGTEAVPTATVAALLRRTSPGDVAAVQPQLIQLRDRLIDLRGRVAEAARRKAK